MFGRARVASSIAAVVTLCVALGACSSSGGGGGGGGGTTTIKVGTSGATGVYLPLYVGVQTGLFKKAGLDVKLQTLTPTAVTAATLSDNIDIGWDGPGMIGGILGQPSAKVIFTAGPTVFYLYGQKGLHTVSDLKGKTVGVTTPGGAIDGAVRAAITKAGLQPGKDVKITYLQTNSAALAAVENGSVAGAGVSPPTSIQASQKGLAELENITPLAPPSILAVNSSWAKSHGPAIKKFITTFKAAVKRAATDKTAAENALRTYVKLTDQAQLDGTFNAYKSVWTVGPYPADQMKAIMKSLASAKPPVKGAAGAKPADVIDNEYVNGS